MKNIEILDNRFNRLCFMDNDVPDGLHYYADRLTTTVASGVYILEFKSPKTTDKVQFLKEGHYVTFLNRHNVRIFMQIRSVDDLGGEKSVYCEDAALILSNSFADIMDKPTAPQTIDYYLNFLLKDTGFKIGINECEGKAFIGFESPDHSILARIREIMIPFQMQFYFSVEMTGVKPVFFINIVKRRLEGQAGFRLSSDDMIDHIERKVDISGVITRLVVRGPEIKEGDTKKAVPKPSPTPNASNKKDRLLQWFKNRVGKVRYSMNARTGPNSYDCSSAVYYALLDAGYIKPASWPYTTETLFSLEGSLLQPINANNLQPGDIFVAGVKGRSLYASGHTGVYYGNGKIIHCNYADNGISITGISGRTGGPVHWYRLRE